LIFTVSGIPQSDRVHYLSTFDRIHFTSYITDSVSVYGSHI
jgi:hypothetical protein